jgi:hypothetical protein
MKHLLLFSLLIFLSFEGYAQTTNFEILPYINGTTSIKDGLLEIGPEFNWENIANGVTFTMKPTIKIPLTNKTDNVLQIDRFTSTARGILLIQYTKDDTKESGDIIRNSINGLFEFGYSDFKYYPTGNKKESKEEGEASYAFEIKYISFFSKGNVGAVQTSWQFRLRYSYDWKASNEVGVVNPVNSAGIITTTNMVIDGPAVRAAFSPAVSLQIYPGEGNFSYSPTIYYDFSGKEGVNNPFNNVNRLRLESWVFFYPVIKDNPNVKIGITPFVSIRTAGSDNFNKIEYGGMVMVKVGTTLLQFF